MSSELFSTPVVVRDSSSRGSTVNTAQVVQLRRVSNLSPQAQYLDIATTYRETNLALMVDGSNTGKKFYLATGNSYIELGSDLNQARDLAILLARKNLVSEADLNLGSLFVRRAAASDAQNKLFAEQLQARVDEAITLAWRSHRELVALWYKTLSETTPEDIARDDRKKLEERQLLAKTPEEFVVRRVQLYADGLISRSQALQGLPEFMVARVEALLNAVIAGKQTESPTLANSNNGSEVFNLLVAMNQALNPLNIERKTGSTTSA